MHIVFSLMFALLVWVLPNKLIPGVDITQTVSGSLRSGDASRLSAHFDKTIELLIDAEQVDFQSVQATHAELILRSFFRKYPPHGFQFIYRGGANRLRYSTGTYVTNGQAFSVYVLMRQTTNQQYVINTLHFRKEIESR